MSIYKIFPEADTTLYSAYPTKNTGLDEILEISVKNTEVASGSDDTTVILWLVDLPESMDMHTAPPMKIVSPLRIFVGHSHNVRALHWNYEQGNILTSGSWDSTSRHWNVETGNCLSVMNGNI